MGIPKDSAAGREHLENYLEQRRAQEDGDAFKAIGRGWCLGSETFRQELLEQARRSVGQSHHARTRRETTEQRVARILDEELDKAGLGGGRKPSVRLS